MIVVRPGTERDPSGIVIGLRMAEPEQSLDVGRRGISHIGVVGGDLILGDDDVLIASGVVDVKFAVSRVVRVKRQSEQTFFAAASQSGHSQKRRRIQLRLIVRPWIQMENPYPTDELA